MTGISRLTAIGAFVAMALRAAVGAPATAEEFSFVQYGDIHLVDAGTSTTRFLERLVARIGATEVAVDFVLDAGDVYQDGDQAAVYSAYKAALGRLGIPAYVVRGNHDLSPAFTKEAWKSALGRDVNFSFVHKGVTFIGFDTARSEPSWHHPTASAETLAWLAAERDKIPAGSAVVLLTHAPMSDRMGLPEVYPVVNRRAVLDLFAKHKLLAVISGHWHGNKEYADPASGTLFTTTRTISPSRANHDGAPEKGYRIFTIKDNAVSTRFVPFP